MSGDFLSLTSPGEIAAAREQLEHLGHVGIEAAYVAEAADPAADEAHALTRSRRPMSRAPGEDVYNLPATLRQGWLADVIARMQETAALLDRDISSPIDHTNLRALLLDTSPRTRGMWHRDQNADEAVVITTLRGQSWLEFPNAAYMLEAGRVVVHDPDQELPHRGVNDAGRQRTGLTVLRNLAPSHPRYKR